MMHLRMHFYLASFDYHSPETHGKIGGVTLGVTAIFELANGL